MIMCTDRMRACALLGACLTALMIAPRLVRGQEVPGPAKETATIEFECPILGQVPYFGRLFRVNAYEAGCPAHAANPNEAERIGIDFEICQDGQCPLAIKLVDCAKACGDKCGGAKCSGEKCCDAKCCEAKAACTAACKAATACQCPANACECPGSVAREWPARPVGQVALNATCACGNKCECGKCACGAACQCGDHVIAGHPGLPVPFIAHHFAPPPFVHAPTPFIAHAPPPHPGGCPAVFEHLLTLAAKSAALEAKLEARDEQAELVGEMLELAQENAKLKAQVELAQAKADLAHQVLQVTLENAQLKSKLAELTSKLESDSVRTARPKLDAPQR
jgi:hypothetical protein